MKNTLILLLAIIISPVIHAQACTPSGDETTYGSNDTWIGYIYNNINFTGYSGSVNEGSAGNPNFDESFGGDNTNYSTNGCPVYTETFSARYKLTKTFTSGNYQFVVGADDGYRLSLDGGTTWIIDHFNDQAYTYSAYATTLSGTYNIVLEYYENGGGNRVTFAVSAACIANGDQSIYGTGNVWNGYIYQGTNFNLYSGMVTEGNAGNPNFYENFGGNNTLYNTSGCFVTTENFSARYRLQKTFANSNYTITVGGDDGYRLSLDGGSTWVIDRWWDQGYNTTAYIANLSGTYDMVLEYYENGGGNEVSFAMVANSLLPVRLLNFNGNASSGNIGLHWQVSAEINTDYYQVERSANGLDFTALAKVYATSNINTITTKTYGYTDQSAAGGVHYYRLRIVDKDGQLGYSPVIKLLFDQKKGLSIFPTVVEHTTVYLSTASELKNASIEMYEMTGRKLQEIKLASYLSAGQTTAISLPAVPPGNYVLICKAGAEIKAKQIIVIR